MQSFTLKSQLAHFSFLRFGYNLILNSFYYLCLSIGLITIIFSSQSHAQHKELVLKIGIYDNPPLISLAQNGQAKGLFADLIENIAGKEGWVIKYVPGSFNDLLLLLESKKIDFIPVVAYSDERSRQFDFNRENVLTNWAQVYTFKGSDIKSLTDLAGKKVAVLRKDIHFSVFKQLLKQFEIDSEMVEVDSYDQVLELVSGRSVAAGIVSRFFGNQFGYQYGVEKSGVVFNPIKILFAFPHNENKELLQTLDQHLQSLKKNETSVYYKSIDKWLGQPVTVSSVLPLILVILFTLALVFYLVYLLFQYQPIRKALGLTQYIKENVIFNVLAVTVFIAILFWCLITYMDYLWFNSSGLELADFVFPMSDQNSLFYRLILVSTILLGGSLVSRILLKLLTEQNRIQQSEQRFDMAMEVMNDGIWDWRLIDNTVLFDSRYYTLSGYEPGAFPCNFEEWHKRVHIDDVKQVELAVQSYLSGESPDYDIEFRFLRQDGNYMWIRGRGKVVERDDEGNPSRFLGTHSDISLLKEHEKQILHQAHYDALTNLPNRLLTLDRLTQLIHDAKRNENKVAILFMDLDDFKKVNDALGHEIGDKLLMETAERLNHTVRNRDTVGRLGGDEFIMLLGGVTDVSDVLPIAENVLNRLRDSFYIEGRELILSVSVGIALYPQDGLTPSDLLRNADSAMYHAKKLGRNTYSFFTEAMNREISRRFEIEEQIHNALDRGEFGVVYQPKIEVSNAKVIGAEALLRWNNPVLGSISPIEFIPIAEQTGLILSLGSFVLSEALARIPQWRKYLPDFRMAVNLSPAQFRDPDLVQNIDQSIKITGVAGEQLELEITEGVLMSGHTYIDEALSELKGLGVRIAMDDFGTGYSSLGYLRNYPFDVLKIDKSFVRDITVDPADRELINATVAMAHGLNLKVVAEGVETKEQLEYLKQLGCDYAQGYFFSKPISAQEFEEKLSKKNS